MTLKGKYRHYVFIDESGVSFPLEYDFGVHDEVYIRADELENGKLKIRKHMIVS